MNDKPAIVIDNGSYNIKAGFACDNHPVSIFRTVVGRPNYLHGSYGREFYEVFVGDDAIANEDDLELNLPVVNGRVVHWENMERIWHHIFYRELKVAPEDRDVILGCSTTTSIQEKTKYCEIFFETLNSPCLCVQPQNILSLYGSGVTTGICVDLGYDTVDINPIYEGEQIKYAHMQTSLAGAQLAIYLKETLENRGIGLGKKPSKVIEDIKKILYLTPNCAMSRKNFLRTYTLPDGNCIEISQEAFMAAEMLFKPDNVKECVSGFMPLHEAIITAAMKCDHELSGDLYDAVVPCGGMATIPFINVRIKADIEQELNRPINLIDSPEPYTVSWLGGATFAGISETKKLWVTKKQFEEQGERIVRTKFI